MTERFRHLVAQWSAIRQHLAAKVRSFCAAGCRIVRSASARRLSVREKILVLFALLVIVLARAPVLLIEPRFWAEEATVHFAYARHHGWLQVLFFVPIDRGYFSLVPNIASLAATRLVSLEQAPLVSSGISLIIQFLPLLIVLRGKSALWRNDAERLLAACLLLVAPAITGEVWLNTVNSQVFCGILAVVLLCEESDGLGRLRRWCYRTLLALAGLTGIYAASLTPAYLIRSRRRSDRESLIQALVLATAATVQIVLIAVTHVLFEPQRFRTAVVHWGQLVTGVLDHHFVRAVFGAPTAHWIFARLGMDRASGSDYLAKTDSLPGSYTLLAGWMSLAAVVFILVWLWRQPNVGAHRYLVSSLLVLESVLLSSTGWTVPAGRYAVVPGIVVLLLLLHVALQGKNSGHRTAAGVLVLVAIFSGAAAYRRDRPKGTLGDRLEGRPSWRGEVASWRLDESHLLAVWPGPLNRPGPRITSRPPWRLLLDREERPRRLEPPSTDLARDLTLIATDEWESLSYPTEGLSPDFRLTVDVISSRTDSEVDLRARLEGAAGEILAERPIRGYPAERPVRVRIDRILDPQMLTLDPARVRRVTVALKARGHLASRVKLLRLRIGARVEGLLDPLLTPSRRETVRAVRHMGDDSSTPRGGLPLEDDDSVAVGSERLAAAGPLVGSHTRARQSSPIWSVGALRQRLISVVTESPGRGFGIRWSPRA